MADADVVDAATTRLLAGIRNRIRTAIDAVVPIGETVGLLNFPNHRNAGDSALWLAGEDLLTTRPATVAYRCAWNTFDRAAFERRVPDGPVVLNAGGNFGDLYPGGQQALREHVLRTMTDRPIIQLPQSIHFVDPANRDRMARLVAAHGRTTILCRDEPSLEIARRHFDAPSAFCPDLVFWVGPFARPAPVVDIVWLARTDPERSVTPPDPAPGLEVFDWLHPHPGEPVWPAGARRPYDLNQRLIAGLGAAPAMDAPLRSLRVALAVPTFDAIAHGWVDRAVQLLGRGRVVVTDRLHAHVLALLAGIPSVVLDNSYGKVHGVIRTTSIDSPLTHLASSVPEALALARELVAEVEQ